MSTKRAHVEMRPLEEIELVSKALSMLSVDQVQAANSGHPGAAMGCSTILAVLYLHFLRYSPDNPEWAGRDRFVLSAGHASALLYSVLHLAGYSNLDLEQLRRFRQKNSATPGHPEFDRSLGVECTSGPLGQGIGNAVGMALAEQMMAARYNSNAHEDFPFFGNKVYCLAGDGCMMEGVSHEAASLAGHLRLNNLVLVYDDNRITIDGSTALSMSEDVGTRFQGYDWTVIRVDGHNAAEVYQAFAQAETADRPVLIIARTTIGKGSPKVQGTPKAHGAPLGEEERKATRAAIGWEQGDFEVPERVYQIFEDRREQLLGLRLSWSEALSHSELGEGGSQHLEYQNQVRETLPEGLLDAMLDEAGKVGSPEATRKLSARMIQVIASKLPALVSGSADLACSTLTDIKAAERVHATNFLGCNIAYGVREHAMGALANGLCSHGMFRPLVSTFLSFLDYCREPLRLAALSGHAPIYVFTHDSVFLGEDGPTHQPVEHLAMLRATPRVLDFRPANAFEMAVCFHMALFHEERPSAIMCSRQTPLEVPWKPEFRDQLLNQGAYQVYGDEGSNTGCLTFFASGSELGLALAAAKSLENKCRVKVISVPSHALFKKRKSTNLRRFLADDTNVVVIEAGKSTGWCELLDRRPSETCLITVEIFGMSAPAKDIAEELEFTPEGVSQTVVSFFDL